jgi:hypothetical protein
MENKDGSIPYIFAPCRIGQKMLKYVEEVRGMNFFDKFWSEPKIVTFFIINILFFRLYGIDYKMNSSLYDEFNLNI